MSAGEAGAQNVDPTQWPAVPGLDPFIETTAHSIRFAGPDRYQTNLALNLALRGKGDFPFDTPDPTSGGAANLAAADDWWGAGTCPRSILVVAGDTFADALAAASLSDPSDRSEQPRVQRAAAADPLFDPVGGFDRVDTAFAPIVVTNSARQGATALAQTARLTASDFAKGGCTTAKEAIIVGGLDAIPAGVAPELVELGYREVFRVSGVDRYDTAARVATALGTGSPPPAGTACEDPDVTDGDARMGWYGNAVAEFRMSGTECRLLPRAVVLADGFTGADALAAGWWTSFWQVPVLLTAPDGSLPPATRTALQTLNVNSIVVLGGTERIPEATVDEAKALSGAVAGRIAGPDRYATSVEMAKQFGGWYPTGDGADFQNDMICLAASSGVGPAASGWPDALAAGSWCGRAGAAATAAPRRLAPSVEAHGPSPLTIGGEAGAHDAVPILLAPTANDVTPVALSGFLRSTFSQADWCSEIEPTQGCVSSGFATAFGGSSGLRPGLIEAVADLVAGDRYDGRTDLRPKVDASFLTRLDMSPLYAAFGSDSPTRACVPRGSIAGVRWLALGADDAPTVTVDLPSVGLYRRDRLTDAASVRSAPVCIHGDLEAGPLSLRAVSLSGRQEVVGTYDDDQERALALTGPVVLPAGGIDPATREWEFSAPLTNGTDLQVGRRTVTVQRASLRVPDPAQGTLTGRVSIAIPDEVLVGDLVAEAVERTNGWSLRGRVQFDRGASGVFVGGFNAELGTTPSAGATWQVDAFRS